MLEAQSKIQIVLLLLLLLWPQAIWGMLQAKCLLTLNRVGWAYRIITGQETFQLGASSLQPTVGFSFYVSIQVLQVSYLGKSLFLHCITGTLLSYQGLSSWSPTFANVHSHLNGFNILWSELHWGWKNEGDDSFYSSLIPERDQDRRKNIGMLYVSPMLKKEKEITSRFFFLDLNSQIIFRNHRAECI